MISCSFSLQGSWVVRLIYIFPAVPDCSGNISPQHKSYEATFCSRGRCKPDFKKVLQTITPLGTCQAAAPMCSCHPAAFSEKSLEISSAVCHASRTIHSLDSNNGKQHVAVRWLHTVLQETEAAS